MTTKAEDLIQLYQRGEISVDKLSELLGQESRRAAEAFLRQHNIPLDYDKAEFVQDLETNHQWSSEASTVRSNPVQTLNNIAHQHQARKGLLGIWKGKVWMSDDFDAPLEEFDA